jgi:hypothetical protein
MAIEDPWFPPMSAAGSCDLMSDSSSRCVYTLPAPQLVQVAEVNVEDVQVEGPLSANVGGQVGQQA